MSDERKLNSSSDADNRRRLSEIKMELQSLMRQKKKYDEEKLKQDAEFLHSEINDLRSSISDLNKEIKNQTQTKMKLQIEMTNLRSRSRIRWTNLTNALRDKRRYEAELKKENKTEEYRGLARREIQSIDAAIPILKKEEEYKNELKGAENAQEAATNKRKKLEENLNKNLRKQAEIKLLLSENAEKLPHIETTIDNLRSERERLLSSSSTNTKKTRRRLSSTLQPKSLDSPAAVGSFEEDHIETEKNQSEEQLATVKLLIQYFHEKLAEHGLENPLTCPTTPASELTSPLYRPITPLEEQTILSSYMDEKDSSDQKNISSTHEPTSQAIAMKLPRNFAPLNLNLTTTNEIIHSPFYDGNEIEYKKELSSDIVNKYGGQQKKSKQLTHQSSFQGKKMKRNRKNFAITHNPQMIALYNHLRSSTNNSDTLPSMPMYEYELQSTIQSLEFLQQSLESYMNEVENRLRKISLVDDEQDEDIRDSALDTVSETSSLIEPSNSTITIPKKDSTCMLTPVDEQPIFPSKVTQIDRQMSDEGYRSVQSDQQQQQQRIQGLSSNQNSPLTIRSKSFDSTDKVDRWLTKTETLTTSLH